MCVQLQKRKPPHTQSHTPTQNTHTHTHTHTLTLHQCTPRTATQWRVQVNTSTCGRASVHPRPNKKENIGRKANHSKRLTHTCKRWRTRFALSRHAACIGRKMATHLCLLGAIQQASRRLRAENVKPFTSSVLATCSQAAPSIRHLCASTFDFLLVLALLLLVALLLVPLDLLDLVLQLL